jgi:hypothetical protein
MSSNFINQVAYLRTTREFPEELHQLTIEVNKTYVDIANTVNVRTIGLFPVNRPAQTGESWHFTSDRHSGIRQVFAFGAIAAGGTLNIPYKITGFNRLIRLFGTVITDAPDQRPIPYSSVTANANIETLLDTVNSQIVIKVGAASPNVVSGFIVFEWISQGFQPNQT